MVISRGTLVLALLVPSVAEQCDFNKVPVQVLTSYFPLYGFSSGSGSGSLQNFNQILNINFFTKICIVTVRIQAYLS